MSTAEIGLVPETIKEIHIPEEPRTFLGLDSIIQVYAFERDPDSNAFTRPAAYVATDDVTVPWLDMFTGKPNGTYSDAIRVRGMVGEMTVYQKNIYLDTAFEGVRTIFSKWRAERRVKSLLD